jgi:very-short-patch-repair endonuclease
MWAKDAVGSPPPARSCAWRGGVGGGGATTNTRNPDNRTQRARRLRRDVTEAERVLWQHLRAIKPNGSHFRRQATIGSYFADFACHEKRLIVELDGGQHNEPEGLEADKKRAAFLESRGYRVLRFWNNDVLGNIEGVMTMIVEALSDRTSD